jgi:hypothetical protein
MSTPQTFGPWLCDSCGASDPHCDFIQRGESLLCYVCDEENTEPELAGFSKEMIKAHNLVK